ETWSIQSPARPLQIEYRGGLLHLCGAPDRRVPEARLVSLLGKPAPHAQPFEEWPRCGWQRLSQPGASDTLADRVDDGDRESSAEQCQGRRRASWPRAEHQHGLLSQFAYYRSLRCVVKRTQQGPPSRAGLVDWSTRTRLLNDHASDHPRM